MTTLQVSAQKQLRQLVEQIERLEEEKKALAGDIRDKFLEAKGLGFDVKVLRQVVRLRKKSATERQEEDAVLEVYLHALGMLEQLNGSLARCRCRGDDRRRMSIARAPLGGDSANGYAGSKVEKESASARFGARPRRPRLRGRVAPAPPVLVGAAIPRRDAPEILRSCIDSRRHKL